MCDERGNNEIDELVVTHGSRADTPCRSVAGVLVEVAHVPAAHAFGKHPECACVWGKHELNENTCDDEGQSSAELIVFLIW